MPAKKSKKKNKSKPKKQQFAFASLVVAALLSLILIGFATQLVYKSFSDKENPSDTTCELGDKDLCIFFSNTNTKPSFRADVAALNNKGVATNSVFETDGDDNVHVTTSEKGHALEYQVIDQIIYLKAADGVWWKQALNMQTQAKYLDSFDYTFEDEEDVEPENRATYTSLEPEWFNSMYCFKYLVVDPASPGKKQYIWFDSQEYLLRRTITQDSGNTVDSTIIYKDVSITEPKDSKVLGPNQHIPPGKSEPETLPTTP
jgi:hypothetical protein